MPAKGTTPVTAAQKKKIALGKALGRRGKDIAAAVGVSESTVGHLSQKPETRALIARLEEKCEAELEALYRSTVTGATEDLKDADKDVRYRTRDQAIRILTAYARLNAYQAGNETGLPPDGGYYLEELLYARRESKK